MRESPITRRRMMGFCAGTFAYMAIRPFSWAGSARTALESVNEAHSEIWRRFISNDGTIFDYTDYEGKVILPTPEECGSNMPNGLGWWTPIENGSFFGGVYMDGLCGRWSHTQDKETKEKVRRLAGGLERLGTAGSVPGFIARGFATDGKTHYPASSDDQSYPWFYGMWRYLTSGIPDEQERSRLVALVERVAEGFEGIQWRIPSDRDGFGYFGGWDGTHFDGNVRLLFVIRSVYDLTGRQKWLDLYREKSMERRGDKNLTRIELIAEGAHYVEPGVTPNYPMKPPIWTSASSQAGLRALVDMESDETIREKYQQALVTNARNALVHLKLWSLFDPNEAGKLGFDIDWHPLNEKKNGWVPQSTVAEAIKLGIHQYGPWKEISPRRVYENDRVRDPLCAAWVIFLSGDKEAMELARREFWQAMSVYKWDEMYTVCSFWAENAYWRQALAGA